MSPEFEVSDGSIPEICQSTRSMNPPRHDFFSANVSKFALNSCSLVVVYIVIFVCDDSVACLILLLHLVSAALISLTIIFFRRSIMASLSFTMSYLISFCSFTIRSITSTTASVKEGFVLDESPSVFSSISF